jgi:hypothetical protein
VCVLDRVRYRQSSRNRSGGAPDIGVARKQRAAFHKVRLHFFELARCQAHPGKGARVQCGDCRAGRISQNMLTHRHRHTDTRTLVLPSSLFLPTRFLLSHEGHLHARGKVYVARDLLEAVRGRLAQRLTQTSEQTDMGTDTDTDTDTDVRADTDTDTNTDTDTQAHTQTQAHRSARTHLALGVFMSDEDDRLRTVSDSSEHTHRYRHTHTHTHTHTHKPVHTRTMRRPLRLSASRSASALMSGVFSTLGCEPASGLENL